MKFNMKLIVFTYGKLSMLKRIVVFFWISSNLSYDFGFIIHCDRIRKLLVSVCLLLLPIQVFFSLKYTAIRNHKFIIGARNAEKKSNVIEEYLLLLYHLRDAGEKLKSITLSKK